MAPERGAHLERRQLDLDGGTLCLDAGSTKSDDGREVDLTQELIALLSAQVERVQALERNLGRVIPYLFSHLHGTNALRAGVKRRADRRATGALLNDDKHGDNRRGRLETLRVTG